MIEIVLGNIGCLSGDTVINLNRCRKGFSRSIEHLYKQWNTIKINGTYQNSHVPQWDLSKPTFIRSFDGERIRLHEIENVVYSGKKQLFVLKLENGKQLKCTQDHKIMTKKGMIPLKECVVSDSVMCDTLKAKSVKKKKSKPQYHYVSQLQYHPFARQKTHKVLKSRLVYEAEMNCLQYEEYISILRTDTLKSKQLTFLDSTIEIHHKDRNTFNNSFSNLQKLSISEHKKLHSHENKYNFNQGVPSFSKIKSITKIGVEDTYDICCKAPHHNFVANGIVVHNSGKTASIVREIVMRDDGKTTFSNIVMPQVEHNIEINKSMIVHEIDDPKNPKKTKQVLNVEFWKEAVNQYGGINVVIDEAHTILNARRGMSKQSEVMSEFIALLRRVIGGASEGYGKLVLITQLDRRIDVIAREMATRIKFCRCHYEVSCSDCGYSVVETNDTPEKCHRCPRCRSFKVKPNNFIIEIFLFENMEKYERFAFWHLKTYYHHYYITDIEQYFQYYDTLQWDNLISD
jgi:hypothetical protein